MHIINLFNHCMILSALSIPIIAFAQDHAGHQHGGEIYQVTNIENAWNFDDDQQGQYAFALRSMIGTDENRVYIKAKLQKPESLDATYNVSAFYSRMLDDFWDAQIGVRYRDNDYIDHVDLVFGLHGLAPYFFESNLYFYMGEDQYYAIDLSFERDFLLTQKLITQPYIELNIVLNDDAEISNKNGLSEWSTGFKTRYEVNKRIKPFVDIGYSYEKGKDVIDIQAATSSESFWRYGIGLELIF